MLGKTLSSPLKALCIVSLITMTGSLSAKIYKCTNAQGKMTFSDKPCKDNAAKKEQIETEEERQQRLLREREGDTFTGDTYQPNANKPKPQSPSELQKGFFQSIEFNELEKFSGLLASNAYLANIRDQDGHTPLYVASRGANLAMIKQLVEAGANPKSQTSFGDTPLFALAMIGETDKRYPDAVTAIDYLLKNGASIYAEDGKGDNILHKASFYGNLHLAQLALKNGISPHMRDHNRSTPIYQAAWTGNKAIIDLLLQHGANIDADIEIGQSPIYGAAWTNKVDIAEFLVSKGARVKKSGRTPLHLAATHGNIEVSQFFIDKGVAVDALDDSGSPLHQAAWAGKTAYIEWLHSKGAKLNLQNSQGETPLHLAVKWKKSDSVTSLLKLGADPNIQNNNGDSAKDLATKSGSADLEALFQ